MTDPFPRARTAAFAGLAASLVGIGLARFAFTPLMPAIVEAGWFDAGEAAYLGAANLAGYLIGALAGARVMRAFGPSAVTRAMMLLSAASFLACIEPFGFAWFFLWRLLSGVAGGLLMVAASSLVMLQTPAARRGRAGGITFTGVGIGVVVASLALPWLLSIGLAETWGALGVLSLIITALAWPLARPPGGATPAAAGTSGPAGGSEAGAAAARAAADRKALGAVTLLYGLCAFGLVPHMVFLVDYVARGLERGMATGALTWTLFGVGAAVGPLAAGRLADRIGFTAALRALVLVEAAAVAVLLLTDDPIAMAISAMAGGVLAPGLVPVALGRVRDLSGPSEGAKAAAWGRATAGFAIGQAAGAYLLAWLFDRTHDYDLLFGIAILAPAAGLALELAAALATRRNRRRGAA